MMKVAIIRKGLDLTVYMEEILCTRQSIRQDADLKTGDKGYVPTVRRNVSDHL